MYESSQTNANISNAAVERLSQPDQNLSDVLVASGFEIQDPYGRLNHITGMSVDDLETVIDLIHRKVAPETDATVSPVARTIGSGDSAVRAAKPDDRGRILQRALDNSRAVADKFYNEGGDIEQALARCGNLIGFAVVLAHPYADGNGRTSRTLGEAITMGADPTDTESAHNFAVMAANRPNNGFRINSYVPTQDWAAGQADQNPYGFLDAVAAFDVTLEAGPYGERMQTIARMPREG